MARGPHIGFFGLGLAAGTASGWRSVAKGAADAARRIVTRGSCSGRPGASGCRSSGLPTSYSMGWAGVLCWKGYGELRRCRGAAAGRLPPARAAACMYVFGGPFPPGGRGCCCRPPQRFSGKEHRRCEKAIGSLAHEMTAQQAHPRRHNSSCQRHAWKELFPHYAAQGRRS